MAQFHFSGYWGKWSRVLSDKDGTFVELDLTPINNDWQNIERVNIRAHFTRRADWDRDVDELPPEVLKRMERELGGGFVDYLLTTDFLPHIDWDKYKKVNNGGAPFMAIRRG